MRAYARNTYLFVVGIALLLTGATKMLWATGGPLPPNLELIHADLLVMDGRLPLFAGVAIVAYGQLALQMSRLEQAMAELARQINPSH
jgi:hypothetical protein